MTPNINSQAEIQKTEKEIFQSFAYEELWDVISNLDKIVYIYEEKGFLKKLNLYDFQFEKFLNDVFKKNGISAESISSTKFENNKFYFKTNSGEEKTINYTELENLLLKDILKTEKKEDIEKRVANLTWAIEKIFYDNNFLINWEIDDKDKLKTSKFWKDLMYKNLRELKEMLDIENEKLYQVYDITWEARKKQDLLKKEIDFYAGVWDDYEWWAFYFKMTTEDIRKKVWELWKSMTTEELFEYIKNVNNNISDNFKRSDMVETTNLKLISWLYDYTFDRLKKENASNKDFIDFIKLITWRWKLEIDKKELYDKKQDFDYKSIDVSENFKDQIIANNALIYVMYKKWWLIEEINSKKEVKLEDEELEWKTPWTILNEAKNLFNLNNPNKEENIWEKIVENLWYKKELDKPYKDLSFKEKVKIWSLARIIKELKNLKPEEIKNPQILKELSQKVVSESFEDLNESLSSNFNESLFDWNWTSAKDLWLTWTNAEIFGLYQDINWNNWLLDWKDTNELWLGAIVLWISLVAWMWILLPVLGAWAAAFTFQAWLIAWAQIWAVSWIASQVFSHKWYDTYTEWTIDVSSKLAIDISVSSIMTASWLQVLKSAWLAFNPDLLFSAKAWNVAWLIDKWFILSEVLATMYISGKVDSYIKKEFIEHHQDFNDNKTWQI